MNRTKIEWANYTWNPIKGLCPEDCKTADGKSYCYARAMYRRFKLDPEPWLDIAELNMMVKSKVTKARVFVCSTFELFHPILDTVIGRVLYGSNWSWRDHIFDVIRRRPDLTFIILTKRPENIDRPMPDNVWLGVSVTGFEDHKRKSWLMKQKARVRFVSYEPMLNAIPAELFHGLDWASLGRLTGHGRKHDPSPISLEVYKSQIREMGVPLFMKNNLAGIRPGPLVQEYPK